MKRFFAFLTALMLCFTFTPALSEGTATSPDFDPGITIELPAPEWAVSINCEQKGQTLKVGSKITLTATITTAHSEYYDLSNYNVFYDWQAKKSDGDWKTVGNDTTYDFDLNADNVNWIFRVIVTIREK